MLLPSETPGLGGEPKENFVFCNFSYFGPAPTYYNYTSSGCQKLNMNRNEKDRMFDGKTRGIWYEEKVNDMFN